MGDLLRMIADAVQMLTLALPIGGMFLILFSLGRGLVKKVWAWGEGSLAKRAVGTLGLATLAALIALLWGTSRSGPLYTTDTWRPISASERGTLGDAVRGVPVVGPPVESFGRAEAPATPTVTPTATATATATATPAGGVAVRTAGAVNLRTGPGAAFGIAGTARAGEELRAGGRTADSAWLQVTGAAGSGWVPADLVQVVNGSIASLPVTAGSAQATGTPAAGGTPAPRTPTATPVQPTATPVRPTATQPATQPSGR